MSVDPYTQLIPGSVLRSGDRELVDWYDYDNKWKHAMWQALSGPQSETDPVTTTYNFYSISADRTTAGYEFIRVNDSVTITLNSDPLPYERVTIQLLVNRPITISGTINNQSSIVLHRAYDLVSLTFYDQIAEWVVG